MKSPPSFEFIDEVTSDLRFVARGETLEAAFAAAADALLAVTLENAETVEARLEQDISLEEPDLELLLLAFLNELVYLRDARGWLLRVGEARVERSSQGASLWARLVGEALDPARHRLATEVKAATAHGLRVRPSRSTGKPDGVHGAGREQAGAGGSGWELWATLDV